MVRDEFADMGEESSVRGWLRYGRYLLAVTGLVAGFVGYRQLDRDASSWDSLYAALQLLVLNAGDTPQGVSTPVALNVGRFLCAGAFGLTVATVIFRLGSTGADRARVRLSRGYRVVFGDTLVARQIAHATVATDLARPRRMCRAVLVGEFDDVTAADLRTADVGVVGPYRSEGLKRLLKHASEIVVAEEDDGAGLEMMQKVRRVAIEHGPILRVLLHSAALARGRQEALAGPAADFRTAIVSIAEASAQRLVDFLRPIVDGPWEHIVVVGRGDVACEIATAAVRQGWVRGEAMIVDTFSEPQDPWATICQERVHRPDSTFVAHDQRPDVELLCTDIVTCCAVRPGPHLVFVAGMADAETLAIGTILERLLPNGRLVTLVDRDPLDTPAPRGDGSSSAWYRVTLASLLADPTMLHTSLSERLGGQLRDEMARLQAVPDSGANVSLLTRRLAEPGPRSATRFALELLEALHAAGWVLHPSSADPDAVSGEQRQMLRRRLEERFPAMTDTTSEEHREHIVHLVTTLPVMLSRLGFELQPPDGNAAG
jgi:hypothetical protein